MHCGSCAALIQEVLAEQQGVRAVSVDLDRGRARVEYDASQLDVDGLTKAIAGAGFSAAPLG
jgi:copper chaperone CopZ